MTGAESVLNISSNSIVGMSYKFAYEGKTYDTRGKPFEKLINNLRRDGVRPFTTIKIGSLVYTINPTTTGKGSQKALIELPTKLNGDFTKNGEKLLQKVNSEWYAREVQAHLSVIQVDEEKTAEQQFTLPNTKTLERKLFEMNIRQMRVIHEYFQKSNFNKYISNLRKSYSSFILGVQFEIALKKLNKQEADNYYLNIDSITILNDSDIENFLDTLFDVFNNKVQELQTKGSGLVFVALKGIITWVSRYEAPRAGTYKPLPKHIANKKACVNVQNTDNECLKYSIVSAVFPAERDAERPSKYQQHFSKFNWKGMNFPASMTDIERFEKNNPLYSINVYEYENNNAVLRRISKTKGQVINLLRYEEHFCWIKNFNRFMGKSNSEINTRYFCERCSVGFLSKERLESHKDNGCEAQFVKLPDEENNELEFKSIAKMLEHPYVLYADFECALNPTEKKTGKSTTILQEHQALAFGVQGVCRDIPSQNVFRIEVSEDAGIAFIKYLIQIAPDIKSIITRNVPYKLTEKQRRAFEDSSTCHICKKAFHTGDFAKVIDHNHLTGEYRGAAHQGCNINLKMPTVVPVLFHNFSGYDGHIIIDALCRMTHLPGWAMTGIANSGEKYKSISFKCFETGFTYRFIDSFGFLSTSLDKLAKNLPDVEKHLTRQAFPDTRKFKLMTQKGFLPYDSITGMESLELTELPEYESLKPVLGSISKQDYENGKQVWETFNCKNLKEYMLLYLSADVRLLADVFENFRTVCLNDYRLDPVHYVSLPAMAWDALLLMTGIKLELITDADMFNMIENGKRGGVSFIAHRHAKANNQACNNYDTTKRTTWLRYLDANNLYGWAMSKPLPVNGFHWIDVKDSSELFRLMKNKDKGYFIECDLEYPDHLHLNHHILPLAPENATIDKADHSPYQLQFHQEKPTEKLITSLKDKTKYVLHHENFKQYLELGMVCKKIHRVIEFNQSPWLKPYIDFNTDKRTRAKNDFEKDLYKLMNNSVFGKTMENVRHRIEPRILSKFDEARLKKAIQKPTYSGYFMEIGDCKILMMNKTKVSLDKPIAVGTAILDLSKTLMYDFHYNVMLPRYGIERLRLCMTDTDSLLYWIATDDINADFKEISEHLDNSQYEPNHPNYDVKNDKVIGKFKDEEPKAEIINFIGLRAKLYSYETSAGKQKNRCKGTSKNVASKIPIKNYESVLTLGNNSTFNLTNYSMRSIRSQNHKLYTIELNKVSLHAFDDKRYLIDSIFSVPYGFKGSMEEIHRIRTLWT